VWPEQFELTIDLQPQERTAPLFESSAKAHWVFFSFQKESWNSIALNR